jgi:cell division protease FtsH
MMPKEETYFHTKTQMLETITGFLGGRVAEELVFNEVSTGASNDFQNATNLARSMVTQYGMSDLGPVQYEQQGGSVFLGRDYLKEKNFSDQVALEIDREQRRIIEECYERAKEVISSNMELLKNIAEYLLKVETINKRDIDEIVATGHLAWCDEKYAPGVDPKEVTQDEEVKEEASNLEGEAEAKVDNSIETEEVNIDDHLVEAPKEDNDGE